MSDYHPKPIDTAEVELAGLLPLAEILGRNLHEVWAQFRIKEGWTYGPTRDDARKLHPCLLPFDELPEADQAHDRAVMVEILKATIALRFRILGEERAAPADDMDDSAEIAALKKHPAANRLLRVLTCCKNIIEPEFRCADTLGGAAFNDSAETVASDVDHRYGPIASWTGFRRYSANAMFSLPSPSFLEFVRRGRAFQPRGPCPPSCKAISPIW